MDAAEDVHPFSIFQYGLLLRWPAEVIESSSPDKYFRCCSLYNHQNKTKGMRTEAREGRSKREEDVGRAQGLTKGRKNLCALRFWI